MGEELFINIWDALYDWSIKSKHLYFSGIDVTKYDKLPYDIIIKLLSCHFDEPQIDLIIWSIYDETPELAINEDQKILVDNAHTCWEYINKLNTQKL